MSLGGVHPRQHECQSLAYNASESIDWPGINADISCRLYLLISALKISQQHRRPDHSLSHSLPIQEHNEHTQDVAPPEDNVKPAQTGVKRSTDAANPPSGDTTASPIANEEAERAAKRQRQSSQPDAGPSNGRGGGGPVAASSSQPSPSTVPPAARAGPAQDLPPPYSPRPEPRRLSNHTVPAAPGPAPANGNQRNHLIHPKAEARMKANIAQRLSAASKILGVLPGCAYWADWISGFARCLIERDSPHILNQAEQDVQGFMLRLNDGPNLPATVKSLLIDYPPGQVTLDRLKPCINRCAQSLMETAATLEVIDEAASAILRASTNGRRARILGN